MLNDLEREKILSILQKNLSDKRYAHVLRVEEKALALAGRYQVDLSACQLAALLHDYTKEWSMSAYEEVVQTYDLDKELLAYGSEILHGPVAAALLERDFGISDPIVSEAVAYHTIGKAVMSDVAKVLFVADYIEDGRDFPMVEVARQKAQESLESAIVFKLQQTLLFLVEKKQRIYPKTIEAYNAWIRYEKEAIF